MSIVDYSRLDKTEFSQSRMQTLAAAVIGLGALGSEVIRALALSGIGKLILIDHDTVHPSNLTRSIFYRNPESIGQSKSEAMARAVRALFPDTLPVPQHCEIARLGYGVLDDVQIMFSCVDNDLARVDIAYISAQTGIPVADGGLGSPNYAMGRISFFPGRGAACYSCLLPASSRAGLFARAHPVSQSCSHVPADEYERPGTPTMGAIIGGMQTELGLRALMARQMNAFSVTVSLTPELKMDRIIHYVSPDCPLHEPPAKRIVASHRTTTREILLQYGKSATLVLDTPVCVAAQCRSCRHTWIPLKGLRAFRAGGNCPSCGSAQHAVVEVLHSIDWDSVWSRTPLGDLDQPDNHRFMVTGAERES